MFDKSKLLPVLNSSKIQKDNPSLYQVIKDLIDGITESLSSSNSSSSGSSIIGVLQSKQVILNNSQVETLPTVPVQIIPAPKPGFWNRIESMTFSAHTLDGGYTNFDPVYVDFHVTIGGEYVAYGPADDSTATPPLVLITQFLSVADERVTILPVSNLSAWDSTPPFLEYVQNNLFYHKSAMDGNAAFLSIDNSGSGNLVGNPTNTLVVTTYYMVEKL